MPEPTTNYAAGFPDFIDELFLVFQQPEVSERDKVLALFHNAQEKKIYGRPTNYLQLAIHIMGLVAQTNYLVSREKADVLVHPRMDDFSPFDFDTSEQLIELGYETTMSLVPEIRKKWKQKSSRLHKFIQKFYLRQS